MSTWRSLDDLRRFTYGGRHGDALRRRREWFDVPHGPTYVLWWTPSGSRPTWVDAKQRLGRLATHGPTADAFTFHAAFAPGGDRLS